MQAPDWQNVCLADGIEREPSLDQSRLALWLKGNRDAAFQYWERISARPGANFTIGKGICGTAALAMPARQRLLGRVAKLLNRWLRSDPGEHWMLPNGDRVERCGPKESNLILIWADETALLDPAALRVQWPQARQIQEIGTNLFVVRGVQPAHAGHAGSMGDVQADQTARQAAERLLAAARRAGDLRQQAAALADLGLLSLENADPHRAIDQLNEALELARQVADQARQCDVLGNLGMAMLAVRNAQNAEEMFQQELSLARSTSHPFAEKVALEHLGILHSLSREFERAIARFNEGLTLARQLADRSHQVTLLWNLAIQYAELGQTADAVAHAKLAIDLLREMGNPKLDAYTQHLSKYLADMSVNEGAAARPAALGSLETGFAGSIVVDAGMEHGFPSAAAGGGPTWLRMAASAARAMTRLAGSGFKKVSAEVHRARVLTCANCEHHTGVRCQVCGCFTGAKAWLPHEDCPLRKWSPVLGVSGSSAARFENNDPSKSDRFQAQPDRHEPLRAD